jgi:enoyl-CoA hydratase/carnithine racemase
MDYTLVLIDNPAPHVRRVTLNRPEKRNALNSVLRQEVITAVRAGESDPDVRVTVIAANGPSFCGGYDLTQNVTQAGTATPAADYPYVGAGGFQRSVVDLWTSMWDLSKPVIAQVHGHCLAGGSELATGCDLVYVAEDARIGYPAVRFGTPDMQYHAWLMGMRRGMELMLTGDSMTGTEAADWGFANRAFPAGELARETLRIAQRVANIPSDVLQVNKRTVHRAMDQMGMRQALRAGTELSIVNSGSEGGREFIDNIRKLGLTEALNIRDAAFQDGRTITAHSQG